MTEPEEPEVRPEPDEDDEDDTDAEQYKLGIERRFGQCLQAEGNFDAADRTFKGLSKAGDDKSSPDLLAALDPDREPELEGDAVVELAESLRQSLRRSLEQQQLQQARLQAIEMQKKECTRWERLHELIGSADGKKFRNFALVFGKDKSIQLIN